MEFVNLKRKEEYMAKEKVAGTLATNIGVNTTNAVTSIESLKNSGSDYKRYFPSWA